MFRFAVVLLAIAAVAYGDLLPPALAELDGSRIVGGTAANINNVPWQLSLRRSNSHFCGATLISATWAVSAAHCTISQSVSSLSLLAGTANRLSGGQVRAVAQVINHPNYNSRTFDHDICLLRVASAFSLGTSVRAASLPSQGASVSTGAYGIVSGWGALTEGSSSAPTNLQQVWVPVVNQASCNTAYWGGITNNMLCAGYWAGGRDACQGDSGGPFVINNQLIGVVSWGQGCARANFPGVYARVPVYRNWIRTNSGV